MKVAVLSGKGGAGKTLVSVNLAAAAKTSTTYIDCDVEEPNGHLFLKPENIQVEEVFVKIPKVDNELCNGCKKCVDFCKFNALAYIKDKLIVFEEVCHSCGGCIIFCPQNAITEKRKHVGEVQKGFSNHVAVHTGILNTGEASGVPIIKKLLSEKEKQSDKLIIIDCPPGSACTVMESIKEADYCILVSEPTIFGAHNLNMVYELVRLFDKPFGVILNKCMGEDNPTEKFCLEKNIKILEKIPFEKEFGKLASSAEIIVEKDEGYRTLFSGLLEAVKKEVLYETTSHT